MNNSKTTIRPKRANQQKQPDRPNGIGRASKYNYKDMKDETIQVHQEFSKRLASIRTARNLSAREMSLSLGQGAGYINNIENGNNLPSMSMFFEICEYLDISPREFFDYPALHADRAQRLLTAFEKLDSEEQELVITVAEKVKKG